jgi:DNA invertase Pin-like site-specific DNA recombinase
MNRAAIYLRISQDRDGRGAGVQRQLEDCQAWAERNAVTLAEVYTDNDVSAYSGKPRPAYRRMCADIKAGLIDAVIVWHLDRLHRSPAELEDFIVLVEAHGIHVVTISGGDYDLTTSDGRAMARVVGAFARKESEDKSRRITRQKLQAAQQGKRSGGGTRAYGYDPTHRHVVPDEAAVIADAATRLLAGETLRAVCNDLNNRNVRTVTGRKWSTTVLRTILMSARISAQVELHGEIISTGDWQPIVTPAQTARLRALLGDPQRRTNRSPRSYPLTGLLVCGLCGARLVARPRGDGRRRYVCARGPDFHGCGKTATLAEPVEELIADAVLHALTGPGFRDALASQLLSDSEAEGLQHQIDKAEERLDELAELYGRNEISQREWSVARAPISNEVESLTKRLGRLAAGTPFYGLDSPLDLRNRWKTLPPSRQRAIVATLIDSITVHPAVRGRHQFDPSRIEPHWLA